MKNQLVSLLFFVFLLASALSSNAQEVISDPTMSDDEFGKQIRKKIEGDQYQLYLRNVDNIIKVASKLDVYKAYSDQINKSVNNASEFNDIAKKCNPSDASLTGKSYNDYIKDMAIKIFQDSGQGDDAKDNNARISSVVTNLVDDSSNGIGSTLGKFVGGFISSTPILNVASKVISGIASFFKSKSAVVKGGTRVVQDINGAIDKSKLKAFEDSISHYVTYYDNALQLNKEFASDIDTFLAEAGKYDTMTKLAAADFTKYSTSLNVDITSSQAMRDKFKYNFKDWYNGTQPVGYDSLLSMAVAIDKLNQNVTDLATRSNKVIDNYKDGFHKLFTAFIGKRIERAGMVSRSHLQKQFAAQLIPAYKITNTSNLITVSYVSDFAEYSPKSKTSHFNMMSTGCCGGGNNTTPLIILVGALIIVGAVVFFVESRMKKMKELIVSATNRPRA